MFGSLYHKFWQNLEKNGEEAEKLPKKNLDNKVSSLYNIVYGKDTKNNVFDIHFPQDEQEKHPTIIVLHGGGYVAGKKENTDQYAKQLASRGFCVINLEFVKCDKNGKYFLDQIANFYDMYNYIKKETEIARKIDFDNIFLAGDSAGGHLAEVIANVQTNKFLDGKVSYLKGPNIKGVILASPIFGPFKLMHLPLQFVIKPVAYGKKKESKILTYKNHGFDMLTKNFPATIMFSTENDKMTEVHKKIFCKKAKKLNFPLEHYTIKKGYNLGHDSMISYCDYYEKVLQKIEEFVKDLSSGVKKIGFKNYDLEEEINTEEIKKEL